MSRDRTHDEDLMDDDALDWTLMARYLAGECPPAEAEAVRRWIAHDPERGPDLELMQRVCGIAGELPTEEELDAQWGALASAIDPATAATAAAGARPSGRPSFTILPSAAPARRRWMKPLIAVAAVLALAVGGVAAWRAGLGARAAAPWHAGTQEFRTTRGQRAVMTLVDGTRVALGPESRMRVAIAGSRREVTLEGEAVFEVVHDSTRPFIVRASGALAEDLGTTFGVRAYPNEPVRVVVAEGVVAVRDTSAGGASAVLEAEDIARVAEDGRIEVEHGVDPQAYLAWSDGRLVFRRAGLAEVTAQLERWFDVRVIVHDSSLLTANVSASFDDKGLDDVLRALSFSLNARVEREGRSVHLRGRE